MPNETVDETLLNQIFRKNPDGEFIIHSETNKRFLVPASQMPKINHKPTAKVVFLEQPSVIKHFSAELQNDEDFILELFKALKDNCGGDVYSFNFLINHSSILNAPKTPLFWYEFLQLTEIFSIPIPLNDYDFLELMHLFIKNQQDFPCYIIPIEMLCKRDFIRRAIQLDGRVVQYLNLKQLKDIDFLWDIFNLPKSLRNHDIRLSSINREMILEAQKLFCFFALTVLAGAVIVNSVMYSLPIVILVLSSVFAAAFLIGFGIKASAHVHGFFSSRSPIEPLLKNLQIGNEHPHI